MFCILRWVNYKSIVVFHNHNGSFEASILQGLNPLVCIKVSWVKVLRIFSTIPPLRVGISIHTIVNEGCQFFLVVIQLSLAWKWSVSSNFCFFIFWINCWSHRGYRFWILYLFIFKNNLIHSFMLNSCFLTCIHSTIASNFFGLECVNKGNFIFFSFVVVHSCWCQFLICTFQAVTNVEGTFIDFINNLDDTSSCRSLAHNAKVFFPSIF